MKVKIPLAIIVLLAIAAGYLLGTESGRERRELLLVRLGRAGDAATDGADSAADAVDELVIEGA